MIETDMTAYKLADEAIGLFLEYRDVHGYSEQEARAAATTETQQGVDAEVELRAAGEITPFPLIAGLEATRTARKELADLHADLDSHDLTAASAYRLSNILRAWDDAATR